jgi:hypothetical protein
MHPLFIQIYLIVKEWIKDYTMPNKPQKIQRTGA